MTTKNETAEARQTRLAKAAENRALIQAAKAAQHDPEMLRRAAKVRNERGHELSEKNALLVLIQADATGVDLGDGTVAGFRRWLAAGRHVRAGEKGFKIWVPISRKTANNSANGANNIDPATGEPVDPSGNTRAGFWVSYVWAESQTDEGVGDGAAVARPAAVRPSRRAVRPAAAVMSAPTPAAAPAAPAAPATAPAAQSAAAADALAGIFVADLFA